MSCKLPPPYTCGCTDTQFSSSPILRLNHCICGFGKAEIQFFIIRTKSIVYCACVCSTLLYGSETWTLSSVQEMKINTFHLLWLRRILKIRWQQKKSPTRKCCDVLDSLLCTLPSASADSAGLVIL